MNQAAKAFLTAKGIEDRDLYHFLDMGNYKMLSDLISEATENDQLVNERNRFCDVWNGLHKILSRMSKGEHFSQQALERIVSDSESFLKTGYYEGKTEALSSVPTKDEVKYETLSAEKAINLVESFLKQQNLTNSHLTKNVARVLIEKLIESGHLTNHLPEGKSKPPMCIDRIDTIDSVFQLLKYPGHHLVDENGAIQIVDALIARFNLTVKEGSKDGWISYGSEEPEVGEVVMVHIEYLTHNKPTKEILIGYLHENGELVKMPDDEDSGWIFDDVVTHWQPLPAPPNK